MTYHALIFYRNRKRPHPPRQLTAETFEQILDELREAYVIRYNPSPSRVLIYRVIERRRPSPGSSG